MVNPCYYHDRGVFSDVEVPGTVHLDLQLLVHTPQTDHISFFGLWFLAASQVGGYVFLDREVNFDGRLWNETQSWLCSLPYHTVDTPVLDQRVVS
jgi:hypothetical protein